MCYFGKQKEDALKLQSQLSNLKFVCQDRLLASTITKTNEQRKTQTSLKYTFSVTAVY